jgi:flagellar basal body-associated protein FliL
MPFSDQQISEPDGSRRKIIIIVAVVAAILLAVLFYFLMRASTTRPPDPVLPNAIRAGSPEWTIIASKIHLDAPEATESKRALGDIVMSLQTTVRNFTGRTITGLEIKGSVVNRQGQPVRERTMVVIPTQQQPELEPNRTMSVFIQLEGMTDADERANIKMEVTGFTIR